MSSSTTAASVALNASTARGPVVSHGHCRAQQLQHFAEAFGGVPVVVDDQHVNGLSQPGRLALGRGLRRKARPPAGERRTPTPIPRPRCAPRSCRRASRRAGATSVRPIPSPPCGAPDTAALTAEHLEDACQSVRRDADPVVAHRQLDPVALAPRRQRQHAAVRRVLGRVVQQVRQDLRQSHRIALDPQRLARQRDVEAVTAGQDHRLAGLDGIAHHRRQLHRARASTRASRW